MNISSSSDEEGFLLLQNVRDNPDGDTPRRIYAQYLIDRGTDDDRVYGEYILAALELAAAGPKPKMLEKDHFIVSHGPRCYSILLTGERFLPTQSVFQFPADLRVGDRVDLPCPENMEPLYNVRVSQIRIDPRDQEILSNSVVAEVVLIEDELSGKRTPEARKRRRELETQIRRFEKQMTELLVRWAHIAINMESPAITTRIRPIFVRGFIEELTCHWKSWFRVYRGMARTRTASVEIYHQPLRKVHLTGCGSMVGFARVSIDGRRGIDDAAIQIFNELRNSSQPSIEGFHIASWYVDRLSFLYPGITFTTDIHAALRGEEERL